MSVSVEKLRPYNTPSKYYQATTKLLSNELHTQRARAVVLGSDIFYSPNCSTLPRLPDNDGKSFYRVANKDDVDEIQQPLWWVAEMAYLPFVPKEPIFHIIPFDKLFSNPLNVKSSKKGQKKHMDSPDILHWKNVEKQMQDIFQGFRSRYGIPEMKFVVSNTLVYNTEYQYMRQYIVAERRCRKWFAMWMGLLSFAIAIAQTWDDEDDTVPLPQWVRTLLHYFDEPVVAGIRQHLALFSDYNPRAGVFLNLADVNTNRPAVDFFVRWKIPVWYRWGEREEWCLRQNPAVWNRWKPIPHLLQEAKSFLVKAPQLAANDEPWKEFFEGRKRRASEIAVGKGPKPTMKVFVWTQAKDRKWERKMVHKRDREEILHDFGAQQKHYDELTNEWDCCEAMGTLSAEELQEAAWDDYDEPICPVTVRTPTCLVSLSGDVNTVVDEESLASNPQVIPQTTPTSNCIVPPYVNAVENRPLLTSVQQKVWHDHYEPETYSPTNILNLLYGFVQPTSQSSLHLPKCPIDKQEASAVKLACGITTIPDSYFTSPTGQAAMDFIKCLSEKSWTPRNEIYDLAPSNDRALRKAIRLGCLQKLPGDMYVFNLGDCATVPWSLAVVGASMAVSVLRFDEDWSDYRMAVELMNRGMQFFTLLQTPAFSPVDLPRYIPRIRLSSRIFNNEDYKMYIQERENLLCNPRIGRAALKQGGILWRLTISSVGYSDALNGPTVTATLKHQCKSFNRGDGWIYIDDYLQDSEKDIICGAYSVYTGQGIQMATKSWWPTAKVWDENVRFSMWNDRLEDIYRNRLQELENGDARPLTSSEWRNVIRAHSIVRRTVQNSTKIAHEFLDSIAHL